MTTIFPSLCRACVHKDPAAGNCTAYPGGIPFDIVGLGADHREPVEGDNGVQFEQADDDNAQAAYDEWSRFAALPSTSRSLTPEALHGEPENPMGDEGDDADSDEDDSDLTDDDAPGPDEVGDDEELDDETLARIHALLDEEDDEAPEAMRAGLALGRERLHEYWTIGKGLRKWLGHPHPWTSLYRHLRKYVGSERAKRMAAKWVHEVTGNWPGSDAHRVATGHKPRGNRIGPG